MTDLPQTHIHLWLLKQVKSGVSTMLHEKQPCIKQPCIKHANRGGVYPTMGSVNIARQRGRLRCLGARVPCQVAAGGARSARRARWRASGRTWPCSRRAYHQPSTVLSPAYMVGKFTFCSFLRFSCNTMLLLVIRFHRLSNPVLSSPITGQTCLVCEAPLLLACGSPRTSAVRSKRCIIRWRSWPNIEVDANKRQ